MRKAAALLPACLAAVAAPASAGTVSTSLFGTASDGRRIDLIRLANDRGMTVRISTRGGAVTAIEAPDRKGRLVNVVLGRPDFAGWEKAGAFNTIVGRYANRIGGGGFSLDGHFYKLSGANRAGVILHSGPTGFASQIWSAQTFKRPEAVGVVLHYVSPDGEGGFPGELTVDVTYTLTNADVLRIDYDARTTKPTVVNLTNHSYFNLGGAAAGQIYNHIVQIFASGITPTDANQIPTGAIMPVAGTAFDMRNPSRLGPHVYATDPQVLIGQGIDHNFVLDRSGPGLTVAARLYDPASGRKLEVRTTEPGVQVYTGNHLDGTIVGEGGRTLRQGDGIAFETQHFPDSPNKSNFPFTVLRPGERFHSTTEFAFSTDAEARKPRR